MSDNYLSENHSEYTGIWWLPEKPHQRCTGTLKLEPHKYPRLTVLNGFPRNEVATTIYGSDIKPIILGLCAGSFLTLSQCQEDGFHTAYIGPPSKSYSAEIAYIHAHFKAENRILYNRILMTYPKFDAWVNIKGTTANVDFKERKVSIEYKRPESLEFSINDSYFLKISFESNYPNPTREVLLKESVHFEICRRKGEASIIEFLNLKSKLEQFFAFIAGDAVYPLDICGTLDRDGRLAHQWRRLIKVPSLTSRVVIPQPELASEVRDFHLPQMLFSLTEVKDKLGDILKQWFSSENLEIITDLFAATLYNPRMYLFHRFLTLSGALEIYHRIAVGNNKDDKIIHEARVKRILDAVADEGDRDWLKGALYFSNNPSLRRRLEELVSSNSQLFEKLKVDTARFVGEVVATRNYFTHYSGGQKDTVLKGEKLYFATRRLSVLLQACFLKELGFSEEERIKYIVRSRDFR